MKIYRRRPVTVQAIQWVVRATPSDDAKPIVDYINENGGKAHFLYDFDLNGTFVPRIMIETLEGTMGARPFDYICRGMKGEYWPVKPDVFEATNEPIFGHEAKSPTIGAEVITLEEHD